MAPKRNPCRRRFCPAAVRMVWAMHDWTTPVAAAAIGLRSPRLWRQADTLDLPARPWAKAAKRIATAAVREAWAREDVPLSVLSAELGMSDETLRKRAKLLDGAKQRKAGRKHRVKPCRFFREMWLFGVGTRSIAQHMGCAQSLVSTLAAAEGLPLRHKADRYLVKPTVADFMQAQMCLAMAASAKVEQAAAQDLWFGRAA